MSDQVIFVTHADARIDPAVPVPDWGLNATGHARHAQFAQDPRLDKLRAIYCSTEQKAKDGAAHVSRARGLLVHERADLGENDRSATGFLPEHAFWPVVDAFFAAPDQSVRGWERAVDAQARILAATQAATREAPKGDLLIVSHGGVGTLLRCALLGRPITRDEGQPHPKGGCWFAFDRNMSSPPTQWHAI